MNKHSTTAAVIVAAGAGKRLGADVPKAFIDLGGRPLVQYSLECFDTYTNVDRIVLVVHQSMHGRAAQLIEEAALRTRFEIVHGGEHRWQSVENGVRAAGDDCDWVLVHDAARPFVTSVVIDTLLAKRDRFTCAITATPMVDTVRRFEGERCVETLDRAALLRVGTPQMFHRRSLLDAFAAAHHMPAPPTDEAMLMEACGHEVGLAWGDPLNFKVTTREDLLLAEGVILKRGYGARK